MFFSLLQAGYMQSEQVQFLLKYNRHRILLTGYLTGTEKIQARKKENYILNWLLMQLTLQHTGKNKIRKDPDLNKTENLVSCEFFNTNIISY